MNAQRPAGYLTTLPWLQTQTLLLRDGSAVVLRPIQPEDRMRIVTLMTRLSEESRFRRFLRPVVELSPDELTYLSEVDHLDHEALIALDPLRGEALGVARYVRFEKDRELAEAAVVVVDHAQGRGLGTAMLEIMTRRARAAGIRRFAVLMRVENRQAIEMFERLGDVRSRAMSDGAVELEIELPESDRIGAALMHALSVAAAGAMVTAWRALLPPRRHRQDPPE